LIITFDLLFIVISHITFSPLDVYTSHSTAVSFPASDKP
jgi:hypothetical protein